MEALILGIVQGITEFLPISSSAHLLLLPYLLSWTPLGLAFDVALHIGTLLAILVYFFPTWKDLIIGGLIKREKKNINLLYLLFIATIPAALIGYFGEAVIENSIRSPLVAITMLIVFGLILWWGDNLGAKNRAILELNWKDALTVGLCQALALIPGVSRSGITMTAGLGVGLTREEATRFSFLLLAPITFGAALTQIPAMRSNGHVPSFIIGIMTSFIVGLLAIHFMLRLVNRYGFKPYVWYRLVIGVVLFFYFLG